jgi:hypothetical protein
MSDDLITTLSIAGALAIMNAAAAMLVVATEEEEDGMDAPTAVLVKVLHEVRAKHVNNNGETSHRG